jgi:hypothetical protein
MQDSRFPFTVQRLVLMAIVSPHMQNPYYKGNSVYEHATSGQDILVILGNPALFIAIAF